jgi:hypothetical protein
MLGCLSLHNNHLPRSVGCLPGVLQREHVDATGAMLGYQPARFDCIGRLSPLQ